MDAVVGINNYWVSERDQDGSWCMDRFGCPVFDILLDPPWFHHNMLQSHMENLYLIVLDLEHMSYCWKYYAPFRDVDTAYISGCATDLKSYKEKEIPLLFAGTFNAEYLDIQYLERKISEAGGTVELNQKWLKNLMVVRMAYPELSVPQIVKFVLEHDKIKYTDATLTSLISLLGTCSDFYIRAYWRKQIIQRLVDSGITVHVAGPGWENLYPSCPPNLVLEGVLDFDKTSELIANSRLVLNITGWNEGLHDRILTTMHNGSVCITNTTPYTASRFQDQENIVLYNLKKLDELPGKVRKLLDNPTKAEAIADAGYKKVQNVYTWETFVRDFILNKLKT